MATKVRLTSVLTLLGYVSLGLIVFATPTPHPVVFLIPIALFGFSMFVQHVEKGEG